jgi:hypothetical protein
MPGNPLNRSNYSRFSFSKNKGEQEQSQRHQEQTSSNYQPNDFLENNHHDEQIQPLKSTVISMENNSHQKQNNHFPNESVNNKAVKNNKNYFRNEANIRNNHSEQATELLKGESNEESMERRDL